jgi:hypothetical protein
LASCGNGLLDLRMAASVAPSGKLWGKNRDDCQFFTFIFKFLFSTYYLAFNYFLLFCC